MYSRNISRHLETDYGVPLSGTKKQKLTDFSASRLDQMLFSEDEKGHDIFNDAASMVIDNLQLESRQRRDMALDFFNPRQELPKDVAAERIVDQIPDFAAQVIDLAVPGDYEAQDQVRLVQDARANFIQQSNLFDNPDSREGGGARGISANDMYSLGGSAAGLKTDRLQDEDGSYINSVDSVQAF